MINTVTAIVDHLPPDVFETSHPSPTMLSSHDSLDSFATDSSVVPPANAQESARNNIIKEMVETERKFVQDLEIMQVSTDITSLPRHNLMSSRNTPTSCRD